MAKTKKTEPVENEELLSLSLNAFAARLATGEGSPRERTQALEALEKLRFWVGKIEAAE